MTRDICPSRDMAQPHIYKGKSKDGKTRCVMCGSLMPEWKK
jgi:hypothetical protein